MTATIDFAVINIHSAGNVDHYSAGVSIIVLIASRGKGGILKGDNNIIAQITIGICSDDINTSSNARVCDSNSGSITSREERRTSGVHSDVVHNEGSIFLCGKCSEVTTSKGGIQNSTIIKFYGFSFWNTYGASGSYSQCFAVQIDF